jgi:hypothetical protein
VLVPSRVYKCSINPFTNPNPIYSHTHTTRDNIKRATVSIVSEFAYKRCSIDGRWEGRTSVEDSPPQGWTNYTPCFTPEMLQLIKKLYAGSEDEAKVRWLSHVLTSRCLVAASNSQRSPSTNFTVCTSAMSLYCL